MPVGHRDNGAEEAVQPDRLRAAANRASKSILDAGHRSGTIAAERNAVEI
jgi:hypothetical protein